MATLTVQSITRAGVTPSYGAAAGGGDAFLCDADTFFHVKNGGGGSINVTLATPGTHIPDVGVEDLVVSVGAGSEKMIGPLPQGTFGDPADNMVDVTYSGVTSVTVAALKLVQP